MTAPKVVANGYGLTVGREPGPGQTESPPIMHHHVNTHFVEMQQWYMKAFDATLRPGQTDFFIGTDLRGVGYMLNFFGWLPAQFLVGTTGRAIDHIGFEVRGLPEFIQRLEAKGIKLKDPYRRAPALGNIGVAALTDPWGTSIELTEGLREPRGTGEQKTSGGMSADAARQECARPRLTI